MVQQLHCDTGGAQAGTQHPPVNLCCSNNRQVQQRRRPTGACTVRQRLPLGPLHQPRFALFLGMRIACCMLLAGWPEAGRDLHS